MKPKLRFLIFALVLSVCLPVVASAENLAVATKEAEQKEQLHGLEGEMKSIAEQQKQVEASIKQAQAKHLEVAASIAALKQQQEELLPHLKDADRRYHEYTNELGQAVSSDYRTPAPAALEMLAVSGSLSQTISKSVYQDQVQDHLEGLAQKAEAARDELDQSKRELEGKRSAQEELERQIIQLEEGMRVQQTELAELLANKSNEAVYVAAQLKFSREAQEFLLKGSIGNAIWGAYSDGAVVKRGDIIGFEGSTGNSTGCHTHFSVIDAGKWSDPGRYWDRLSTPSGELTQAYGMTSYARGGAYGGNIHNGLDIVQGCGKPVKAAADGVIVRDNRTDRSGFGHYIIIRHDGGLMSLYGHLL